MSLAKTGLAKTGLAKTGSAETREAPVTRDDEVAAIMRDMGRAAQEAAHVLSTADPRQKNEALNKGAEAIRAGMGRILDANAADMEAAEARDLSSAMLDRLKLNEARVAAMADGVEEIAALRDPVGEVIAEWDRPNGLHIQRRRTPIGVIGIIYESRPNVTADAGALCLKSGNAAILRGGSESFNSSRAIHACLVEGLKKAGLPEAAIGLVPTTDRAAVGAMLSGLDGNIDLVVPRGGRNLVERVQVEARVPVFSHLDGICHVYIHEDADLDKAVAITVNAKMRRTGICGAAETLLVDRAVAKTHLKPIIEALLGTGCRVLGDETVQQADDRVGAAGEDDWSMEYLDAVISAKVVDGLDAAMAHIAHYGSNHTDTIVTENDEAARRFLNEVDSAIVLHNASTQFADGGEFGMGAEIGIATGKLHARGPVGVEQLTSFKYVVLGEGQIRP